MGRRFAIFAIAAWSGYYVMAVELLSGRILAPSFGNSIYVWGGIITVFMLALSLGYLLGGQLSLFTPTLRRLGLVLIAAALASLPIVLLGDRVLDWIFEHIQDPRYASLSPAERLCVSMCYGAGLSHGEAADALNLPLGTVKSHVKRGLEKLRARLAPGSEAKTGGAVLEGRRGNG